MSHWHPEPCGVETSSPKQLQVGQYLLAAGILTLGARLREHLNLANAATPRLASGHHVYSVEVLSDGEFTGTLETRIGDALHRRPIQGELKGRYELTGNSISVWVSPLSRQHGVRVRLLKNGEPVLSRHIQAFQGRVVLVAQ